MVGNQTHITSLLNTASENITDVNLPINGWVKSSATRGTIDILWSCCVTILLCCWVSTHPNVPSPTHRSWDRLLEKINLSLIGLLGPDFLFGIALGQLSSARRSVKRFNQDKELCLEENGKKWTYTHAFFVDMGGIFLISPDFPKGFPINAEQLYYLVKHNIVDFPDMEKMEIEERNGMDTLSRLITCWQVLWFVAFELQRARDGLPMTTLELTTLSFAFTMLMTSICWYYKPEITKPRPIPTKGITVDEIRSAARQNGFPDLPLEWYRTPLDFISRHRFGIDTHWAYYTSLSDKLHLHFLSRRIHTRPWDRFPSDLWLPLDYVFLPLGLPVALGFSASFLGGWNFYFNSSVEMILWKSFSAYHCFFSLYGSVYYMIEVVRWHRLESRKRDALVAVEQGEHVLRGHQDNREVFDPVDFEELPTSECRSASKLGHPVQRFFAWIRALRNISPDQDPGMTVSLRVVGPVTVTCVLYVFCRLYLYAEDFASLRTQPVGAYIIVNQYIPFLGI